MPRVKCIAQASALHLTGARFKRLSSLIRDRGHERGLGEGWGKRGYNRTKRNPETHLFNPKMAKPRLQNILTSRGGACHFHPWLQEVSTKPLRCDESCSILLNSFWMLIGETLMLSYALHCHLSLWTIRWYALSASPIAASRPPYQWTNRYVPRAQNSNLESSKYEFHMNFGYFDPLTPESNKFIIYLLSRFWIVLPPPPMSMKLMYRDRLKPWYMIWWNLFLPLLY